MTCTSEGIVSNTRSKDIVSYRVITFKEIYGLKNFFCIFVSISVFPIIPFYFPQFLIFGKVYFE